MKAAITIYILCLCLSLMTWPLQAQLALHVDQNKTVLFGQDTMGEGTKLMWIPSKSAFRAGEVSGNEWDYDSVGDHSMAIGWNTTASGGLSTAMGNLTTASGSWSTAMGRNTTASGLYSTAMGLSTTASGLYSTAMGQSTTASGQGSIAMGTGTTAHALNSTAIGTFNANGGAIFDVGIGTYNDPNSGLTVWKSGQVNVGSPGLGNKLLEFNLERTWAFVQHSSGASTALKLQCDPNNNNKDFIIDTEGHVGINDDSPVYKLELPNASTVEDGQARAYDWDTYSDARVKRNVDRITSCLDNLLSLRPVSYDHHTAEFQDSSLIVNAEEYSREIGFIAQEVYPILPEVVYRPEDENTDLWSMNYSRVVAVLTGAVQEQQAMIEDLRKEVNQLKMLLDDDTSLEEAQVSTPK